MTLHVTTRAVVSDAPLLALAPEEPGCVWLQHGDGFVAWGEAARFDAGIGDERFDRAAAWIEGQFADARIDDPVAIRGSGPIAFSSFTFADGEPGSVVVVPQVLVGRRDGTTWVTTVGRDAPEPEVEVVAHRTGPRPPGDRVRYAGSSKPDVLWLETVATAVERLDAGDLEKVVLARDHAVWSQEPFHIDDLAWRLHERFPGCLTFAVDRLVGATPELLIRRFGREISSLALAGSAPRGADPARDAELGATLLGSDKDRREHALAADSVAEVLAAYSADLSHGDAPHLLALDNVQHLATRFAGTLDDPAVSALELAAALHPTAAVGGTPTAAAVALIAELEGMERGRYTGPVGWQDAAGDGEFGIALRCAQLSGARARLFAGAGIVRGSRPADELEETRIKLLAMQRAFGD